MSSSTVTTSRQRIVSLCARARRRPTPGLDQERGQGLRSSGWVLGLIGLIVALGAGATIGARLAASAARLPHDVIAIAQSTRMGGNFMIELDSDGSIVAYAGDVEVSTVPPKCVAAANAAAPGGHVVGAAREVIRGRSYWEIEKEVDGLRVEILVDDDGVVSGSERVLSASAIPAGIVDAARTLVPSGAVAAVERVEGPETKGGVEHHVKIEVSGELVRVRVTKSGAVERLRKLRSETKVGLR